MDINKISKPRIKNVRKRKINKKRTKNVTPINIYLPNELVLKIKNVAKMYGLTMAGYIRLLLINNHKNIDLQ